MIIKKESHPSGDTITFNDRWHQYKSVKFPKKKFVSGTKFLGKFFAPFARDEISMKYAKKHDMKQEDVLTMWDRKGEVGRECGNLIHNYLEARLLGKTISHKDAVFHPDKDISDAAAKKIKHADTALEEVLDTFDVLQAEKIVASLKWNVAGMIDLFLRHKKNNHLCFGDWKTNAKINLTNPWQQGLYPLKHLDDCAYSKYAIQLNLYQKIAVQEEYIIDDDLENIDRQIFHIRDDGYKIYLVQDLQKEIDAMLKTA